MLSIIASLLNGLKRSHQVHALIIEDHKLVFETLFVFARAGQLESAAEVLSDRSLGNNGTARKSTGGRLGHQKCNQYSGFSNRSSMLKDIITVGNIWSNLSVDSRNHVQDNCYWLISSRFLTQVDRQLIGHIVYDQYERDIISCIELVLAFEKRKSISDNWITRQMTIHFDLLSTVNIFFVESDERDMKWFGLSSLCSVFQYLAWLASHCPELSTLTVMTNLIRKILYVSLPSESTENLILTEIVSSEEIRHLICIASIDYRLAFCRLVDERILQLTSLSSSNNSQSTNPQQQEIDKLKDFLDVLKLSGPPSKRVKIDPLFQ